MHIISLLHQGEEFNPKIHCLGNEAPNSLNEYNQNQGVEGQIVPPGVHRRNASEISIQIWKKYFITVLYSTDPNFQCTYFVA